MAPGDELSPRQRVTLEWVRGFIRDHGMPPTVREIGHALGIKSSSAFDLLKALERKGYVRRGDQGARSLIVGSQSTLRESDNETAEVPVIGRIAAGRPIEALQHDRGTIPVNRNDLRGGEAFALKVQGDSMVEAGIRDGDYVVVRRQETANDGDIVVALIENEATLKRFYRERGGIRLEPANLCMTPIHVATGEFRIQGKLVSVVRIM